MSASMGLGRRSPAWFAVCAPKRKARYPRTRFCQSQIPCEYNAMDPASLGTAAQTAQFKQSGSSFSMGPGRHSSAWLAVFALKVLSTSQTLRGPLRGCMTA